MGGEAVLSLSAVLISSVRTLYIKVGISPCFSYRLTIRLLQLLTVVLYENPEPSNPHFHRTPGQTREVLVVSKGYGAQTLPW